MPDRFAAVGMIINIVGILLLVAFFFTRRDTELNEMKLEVQIGAVQLQVIELRRRVDVLEIAARYIRDD